MAVECSWMHTNKEAEKKEKVGGMRDHSRVLFTDLIFESEWTSGDWCAQVTLSLSLSACVCDLVV